MEAPRPRLPDTDIVVIVRNPHRIGQLGKLLAVIGEEGAAVGDIKTRFIGKDHSVREVTVSVLDTDHTIPEIYPEDALAAGAAFAADGRSVNNALAFPGLFNAALQVQADTITSAMKIGAAEVFSTLAPDDELVPSPFHPLVHQQVVDAVCTASTAG